MQKNEQSLKDLLYVKCPNIYLMGIPKGEEREKGTEKYLKKKWPKTSQIKREVFIYQSKKLNKFQESYSYLDTL